MESSFDSLWGQARSWMMYYARPWQVHRMQRFYSQFLGPGSLAFDLGSHLGNRIEPWIRLGARVVAVEPQQRFYDYLRDRYGDLDDVTLCHGAAGEFLGRTTLHVSDRTPTVSSLSKRWQVSVQADSRFRGISWNRTEVVEVTTLDQLIEVHGVPDFCKIDVEGFELEVLRGLSTPVAALSFEFIAADKERAMACLREIQRIGAYEFNYSFRESMKWSSPSWLTASEAHDFLGGLPVASPSGDLYARLKRP